MTVFGKVLVFINLFFSLVIAGLLVVVFANGVRWKREYENLNKNYQVANSSLQAYAAERDKIIDDGKAEVGAVKDLLTKTQDALSAANAENKRLNNDLMALHKLNTEKGTVATSSLAEVKHRQTSEEQLRQTVQKLTRDNIVLVKDNAREREQRVAAEIRANTVQDQNQRLVKQLEEMAKDIARAKANNLGGNGTTMARAKNPPPEDVEGLVSKIDPSGLVSLTIGSDAGLSKGNTLEAMRYSPTARYLGTLRIVEVTPHQAIAQPVGRLNAPLRVGDRVASRILGS